MNDKNAAPTTSAEFSPAADNALQTRIDELEKAQEALNEQLTAAQAETAQFKDASLRSKAELQNTIKRMQNDIDRARAYGGQKLLEDLIPVVDSLELGLANDDSDETTDNAHAHGMQLTLELLLKTLTKHGIQQVNPVGEAFDPEFHEAMTMQATKEHKPNTVVTVFQKGYVLKDRVIRPARVIVATAEE